MTSEQDSKMNVLTFTFSEYSVSPVIDGKDFLSEWDLGSAFVPLQHYELAEPMLALDDIAMYCEKITLESFNIGSCLCGYTGCGAVYCDVTFDFGEMVWHNFGSSAGALPDIKPFRFDREQVIDDLRKAYAEYKKQHKQGILDKQ